MTPARPSERHLRPEGLREYLAAGAPALVPIDGNPRCFLDIDPPRHRVAIQVPWSAGELPDLVAYRHFFAEVVVRQGGRWGLFGVTGHDVLVDAYPVICAVADRVQLDRKPFGTAVRAVLESYHELLRGLGRLSEHEEVGLFGELMVLDNLIEGLGEATAVAAWRGAASEEHDFGLPTVDVEVKTTTGEARRHWVGTATQLEPTVGRPLWLMSVQLTSAGSGGRTLPELVDHVRAQLVDGSVRTALDQRLAKMRWRDDQAGLYHRRLRLRTNPAVYRIDDGFPAITPPRLATAGIATHHIAGLTYLLDLSGLAADSPPPDLAVALTGGLST